MFPALMFYLLSVPCVHYMLSSMFPALMFYLLSVPCVHFFLSFSPAYIISCFFSGQPELITVCCSKNSIIYYKIIFETSVMLKDAIPTSSTSLIAICYKKTLETSFFTTWPLSFLFCRWLLTFLQFVQPMVLSLFGADWRC